jgi:hypothetical protein
MAGEIRRPAGGITACKKSVFSGEGIGHRRAGALLPTGTALFDQPFRSSNLTQLSKSWPDSPLASDPHSPETSMRWAFTAMIIG